jgi:hypothetical protein
MARFEMTCATDDDDQDVIDIGEAASYLVDVHVALCPAASLEDDQRKVIDEPSTDHLESIDRCIHMK